MTTESAEDAQCHHCGAKPDPDGDHSCPCPLSDSECLEHTWEPLTFAASPEFVAAIADPDSATKTLRGEWAEADRAGRAAGRELMRAFGITRLATWILDQLTKGFTR